ncbi:LexA family protein [Marinobacter sp.]|uniref:LexA family protein n=1 Tax=Marinobacter sp. TaxID=50741 RepID=UPI0035C73BDB
MEFNNDMKKQAFGKRLEEAAKAANMHYYGMYTAVGRHFGVTPRAVQKWFLGESIPHEKIDDLANYYGVRSEWLRSGKGPMREVEGVDSQGNARKVEIHSIPVITPELFQDFVNGDVPLESLETVLTTGPKPQVAYAIKVEDNSLSDRVLKGMYVVVDYKRSPGPDDLGVVYFEGSFIAGSLVKRGNYTIIPPNPAFPPINLGPDPVIAGTMISIAQQPLTR